jgi:hypothetical protein
VVLSTPGLATRGGIDPSQGSVDGGGRTDRANGLARATVEPAGVVAATGPPCVAVLLMSRLRPAHVPWAVWRLARGAASLGPVPGMRFARVLGSGRQGGFGLKPGLDCQGVFAGFDDLHSAQRFVSESSAARDYGARAIEGFAAVLVASSARGSWGGQRMAAGLPAPLPGQPIAALTRAAIRPRQLMRFWRHSPPAEAQLAQAPGCRLAVGLGEAPLLRQATFSLWDSVAAMDAYARQGSHQRAIEASLGGSYFSEWMFVRFVPVSVQGQWHGRSLAGAAGG